MASSLFESRRASTWIAILTAFGHAPAAEPEDAKPFMLFMGAEIAVEVGREPRLVKAVDDGAFVVVVDNKPVTIRMDRDPIAMRIVPQLKLSDKTATVGELKFDRVYTPANDPHRKWAAAQSAGAGQAALGNAAALMGSALMGDQLASARGAALGGPAGAVGGSTAGQAATAAYQNEAMRAGSDFSNNGYQAGQLQRELEQQLYDAVQVTCKVSAPRPMRDPYIVFVTHYREKDRPGATKVWIYAKQIERLDETPYEVRVVQGGFPPGFELVKQEVHLYGSGRELGTNVSEKGVRLSREDAHQYIVLEHLAKHKRDTVPASVALGGSPTSLRTRYDQQERQTQVYVKVGADGMPAGIFRNEKCTQPMDDDFLQAFVREVRFKPALQSGKPAESVARLRIDDLAF